MGKPNGGAHVEERKKLLAEHGQRYASGELRGRDLVNEVQDLEEMGITFPEIVEARERAMKKADRDKHKGAEVRVHS